ncbi:MAG: S-layer homology domain-containing protein [Firmicutes bacterium]|nr:S-layer homology domain-containing protein [Bacillota bacterium]
MPHTVAPRPSAALARRLGAAGLAAWAALAPAALAAPRPAPPPPVHDLAGVGPQAEAAILADLRLGLMAPTAPGRFDPAGTVTRAQAVRMLVRTLVAAGALPAMPTAPAPLPFADVSPSSPYDPAIAAALRLGLLPRPAAGPARFLPTALLRRADLAAWTLAASLWPARPGLADPYRDLGGLSPAARAAILTATSLGLVPPAGRGAWDPGGAVTRAQMAVTLWRLDRLLVADLPAAVRLAATAATVAAGAPDPLTVTVLDGAGRPVPAGALSAYRLTYQVSAGQGASAAQAAVRAGALTAARPGVYGVAVELSGGYLDHALGASLAAPVVVYGPPAAVTVSAPSTLTADGLDTATATLTVVDAGGRTVADFDGTVTVASSDPAAVGVVGPQGAVATAPLTVVAQAGVARVSLRAGSEPGAQAVIDARAGDGVAGQAQVTAVAQVATRVAVEAAAPALADKAGASDLVTAAVVDQAGFPMAAGTYPIAFRLAPTPSPTPLASLDRRGAGPVTATFTGGSSVPPTVSLVATGAGAGAVTVEVSTTAAGVRPGSVTVTIVGGTPPGPPGSVDGLSLTPLAGASNALSVGGAELYSLSYTGAGATPVPTPAAIAVTLSAASTNGGQVAFTDLPPGAVAAAGGASAVVTLPAGTASVEFGLVGVAAGSVSVTATASLTPPGATSPTALAATLPVTVSGPATNPVAGVALSAGGATAVVGEAGTDAGVPVTIAAPGQPVAVTLTLVGTNGQSVFAPQAEVVLLSDQGVVAAPDGARVPANAMSPGGAFRLDGSAPTQVVVIPAGSASEVVAYTNADPGTYTLEAEVLDLGRSGLTPPAPGGAGASPAAYALSLAAVGLAPDDVLGDFASALAVASDRLAAVPAGEQVSPAPGGGYTAVVPWPGNTPPPAASLYAEIAGQAPAGPVEVPLGPPPAPAYAETLSASAASLDVPADPGQATLTYRVVDASGKPVAGARVQVVLTNAAGAALSLSPGGETTLLTVTTGPSGTAAVTVYGDRVPDVATLSATLPAEPALPAVTTAVQVVSAGGVETISAPPTELGATQFTADQGGEPLVFRVTAAGGAPAAGVTVAFSLAVGSTGLSLSATHATTNRQGLAVVRVRGFTTSAQGAVVASLPGAGGASVTTGPISVTPGAPAALAASLPPGDAVSADQAARGVALSVVLEDRYGNPIPGPTPLALSATGPLAPAGGTAAATTDGAGAAAVTLTDPAGTVGESTLTVTDPQVPGLSATLPLTVVPGAPAHVTVQPVPTASTQAGGVVGLEVTATDAFGNPVTGTYPVRLAGSAVAPSPNGASAPQTLQSVAFHAGAPLKPILVEPVLAQTGATLTVSVAGLAPVPVPGTLDVAPGPAAFAVLTALVPASGPSLSAQSAPGPWQSPLSERLPAPTPRTGYTAQVQVTDAYGNPTPASGMEVDVAVLPQAGGGSAGSATLTTDADGRATFLYTAGPGTGEKAPAQGDAIDLTLAYTGNQTQAVTGGY